MTNTPITVIGNLVDDPELRFIPSGAAVANFRIASTPRTFDKATNEWKDGEALFLSCSVWRQQAENVAESFRKGMRVIVTGKLKARSYETREGEKRTVFEVEVDEVGPSMKYATADVSRNSRDGNWGGSSGGGSSSGWDGDRSSSDRRSGGGSGRGGSDPWGSGGGSGASDPNDPWAPRGQSDEPPF